MKVDFLTKAEKKKVLGQVAIYVARALDDLKRKGMLFVEIAKFTGLTPNRISELVNNHELNELGFKALLEGGIVNVEETLKAVPDLTEKEKAFINGFRVHKNKHEIGKEVVGLKDIDIDILTYLRKSKRAAKSGVDIMRLLDKAIRDAEKGK